MPAFFLRNSKLLQHHAIHCKATIYCRKNRSTSEIEREANHIPFWSSLLFNKEKFAAFHLEIEVMDRYDQWDYRNFLDLKNRNRRNVDVGPTPSLYSFFRQNFVLNTTRLWLDFSGKRDENASEKSIEDVLYSDWRLDSILRSDENVNNFLRIKPPSWEKDTIENFNSKQSYADRKKFISKSVQPQNGLQHIHS